MIRGADVGGRAGGAGRRAGDRAGEPDDRLDRGGGVAGEVAVQRLGDHPRRGGGRQHGGVDPAPDDLQERGSEAEEQHHDRDRVQDRARGSTPRGGTASGPGGPTPRGGSRYQPPLASAAGGRCTERRIRSEFTFRPAAASSAGSTVSAASMPPSRVATPP